MLKMLFTRESNSNLVLKFAPDSLLMVDVAHEKGNFVVKGMFYAPLKRQVDPARPSADFEILQDALSKLVESNGLVGRDVSVVLPSSCSASNTHLVPFDLDKKAEVKEFSVTAQEKEFWQEFEPEVQDCKLPVFGYQYLASGNEQGTSHVFMSWANQELLNKYIELALSAQLKPVALIPELQAILNLLTPSLDRLERESFVGVLHLARGRSRLVAVSSEQVISASLNVSELDEELLDEIETVSDTSGEFWAEVGARIGSSLKQAVLYLREQEGVPQLRSIYVVSEAAQCERLIDLYKANFNLAALKRWQPLRQIGVSQSGLSALHRFPNQTAWASLIGAGLQGLSAEQLHVPATETPRLRINLHPQRTRLVKNRSYRSMARYVNRVSVGVVSIFVLWMFAVFVPGYFYFSKQISGSKSDLQIYSSKKSELDTLAKSNERIGAQISSLKQADKEDTKSRFALVLPGLLPSGVELSEMSINDNKISITGYAISSSGAQTLLNNINEAKLIKSAVLEMTKVDSGRIAFFIEGQTGQVN